LDQSTTNAFTSSILRFQNADGDTIATIIYSYAGGHKIGHQESSELVTLTEGAWIEFFVTIS